MKIVNIKTAVMGLILGASLLLVTPLLKAESVDTTKGTRLSVTQGDALRTSDDFESLHQNDKIMAHCPMMKETHVTSIRNVDSKGHATIQETKNGYVASGCTTALQKKPGSKEVSAAMACPSHEALSSISAASSTKATTKKAAATASVASKSDDVFSNDMYMSADLDPFQGFPSP